jgi:arylsulfatase A-like enzyme
LLATQGTTYDTHTTTYPLTTPARVSYLTSQYPHNNGVEADRPPDGGEDKGDDTLPAWLHRAG